MNKNGNRIDASAVFKMVKQFFGPEEAQHEENADIQPLSIDGLPLLRIACMGNAEKTIQGELFRHLRCNRNLNAVIECGYRGPPDRHIDIMVFDHDWSPIVTIELKHYSPHQGTINPLLGGLEADYDKHRPEGLPLIQIGLYTEIDSVDPFPIQQPTPPSLQYYRFLTSYVLPVFAKINPSVMKSKFAADEKRATEWIQTRKPPYTQVTKLIRGRHESFQVSGSVVTGRVNWIAMLAPANLRGSPMESASQ